MGIFGFGKKKSEELPPAEEPRPEQVEEDASSLIEVTPQKKFNYEEAWNDPNFVSFWSNCPESVEIAWSDRSPKIQERYENYKDAQALTLELPKTYKEEMEPAFGVKLEKSDFGSFEEFFTNQAIANPAETRKMASELRIYKELQEENGRMEAEIKRLVGDRNIDEVRAEIGAKKEKEVKMKGVAKWATGWPGFFNPKNSTVFGWLARIGESKEFTQKRKAIRGSEFGPDRQKILSRMALRYRELARDERFLAKYPAQKKANDADSNFLRQELFVNLEPVKEIYEEIEKKVTRNFESLIGQAGSDSTAKKLDKAQEYLNDVRAGKTRFDETSLKHLPLDEFQNQVNEHMENLVIENIEKEIEKFNVRNKPLQYLQNRLEEFVKMGSSGVYNPERALQIVLGTVNLQIDKLTDEKPKNFWPKILVLKEILAKLQQPKAE